MLAKAILALFYYPLQNYGSIPSRTYRTYRSKHKSGKNFFKDRTLIIRQGSRNLLHGYMTLGKILRGEATQKFGSSSEDLVIHQQNTG